jgi:lactoylglutathione lyase
MAGNSQRVVEMARKKLFGEDCPMAIKGLAHIGVMVTDLPRSVAFYQKTFAAQVLEQYDKPHVAIALLDVAGVPIELLQFKNAAPRPAGVVDHVSLLADDVRAEVARLQSLGVTFEPDSPREVLDGCVAAFFSGPDGERIELFQPRQ